MLQPFLQLGVEGRSVLGSAQLSGNPSCTSICPQICARAGSSARKNIFALAFIYRRIYLSDLPDHAPNIPNYF
eukprot:364234-Chlamydomonas_euryale.AAC.15